MLRYLGRRLAYALALANSGKARRILMAGFDGYLADDPRTANVFDPAIRGKTDQFVMKFRKP